MGKHIAKKGFEDRIPEIREDAISQSKAVRDGQLNQHMAPFLPDFPYNHTEARFMGEPIDFIVFRGIDGRNVSEIVFVEVKTAKSQLSDVQKSIKSAIQGSKVSWHEYRIPNRD
ncbi:hypothetical protein HYV80_07020 [Candidatus Woesearchaeota archaeon]|nr:hypothetical protein [Candidatus Woesearchaeota archaeon]